MESRAAVRATGPRGSGALAEQQGRGGSAAPASLPGVQQEEERAKLAGGRRASGAGVFFEPRGERQAGRQGTIPRCAAGAAQRRHASVPAASSTSVGQAAAASALFLSGQRHHTHRFSSSRRLRSCGELASSASVEAA